jgi:Calx-beta domain/Beta-propeller repeat
MKSSPRLTTVSSRVGRRPVHHASRPRLQCLEERALLSGAPGPAAAYGNLPLAFEANQGQAASQVDFVARGSGYALALTSSDAVLALHQGTGGDVLHFGLVGADPSAKVVGRDELVTKTNYLIGSDPSQWRTNVPNYAKVEYQGVYPGIGLVYYGNQGQLEYDFTVAPGADPGAIRMSIQGAGSVAIDAGGNLVLHAAGGDLVQHAPVIYQESGGTRQAVAGAFVLGQDNQVTFRVGAYDTSLPLVIDPILSYSTYLGGSSGDDQANAIAVDAAGSAYITGTTYSTNFPTTVGSVQTAFGGSSDAFVAKLNASGTGLLYSTYLGGSFDDNGNGIAVDGAGHAYVTGTTDSSNFPTTAGAFQQANNPLNNIMGFVAELNATGSALIYSTYLGGSDGYDSQSSAIAVDASGAAYLTGYTSSLDFPTKNPLQAAYADSAGSGSYDAFITKLNASGTALVYSTYLGGTFDDRGKGIAVDAAGNAYVTGWTEATHPTDPSQGIIAFPTTPGAFQPTNASPSGVPFVTKVNAAGSALVYSTFLGGTTGYNDWAAGIAVDAAGNAHVAGSTQASDFPTTPGAFQRTYRGGIDTFVATLNPAGSALVSSTYLGGSGTDQALGIAVDGAGNSYVTGITDSVNLPTANALQPVFGGNYDAFVTEVNAAGTALVFSTYLGGTGLDAGTGIAVDTVGNPYVAGQTSSANFPTTSGAIQRNAGGYDDAFIAKLAPAPLTLSINDVSIIEGNTGTANAIFTVSLADISTQTVTVSYATSDGTATAGSDYASISGTLTFAPGQTSQTVTVPINGDVLVEPNETFFVNLSNPTIATIARGQGVGTILDDDATKFYVVNDGASGDRTYDYGAPGNALANNALNSGNTAPRGAASTAAGTTVWVIDANKKVYVYNTTGGLLGSWSAGSLASNATVEGIATNGTDVWIVDAKQDKVFRYTNAAGLRSGTQNAASSFSLNSGNASPKDIVTDGTYLWVVNDSKTDTVFKYNLSGTLLGSWTITGAGTSPTGITLNPAGGGTLWIVDSGTDLVYELDNARGLTSGSLSPSTSFALTAGNTNPQGIADPPAGKPASMVVPGRHSSPVRSRHGKVYSVADARNVLSHDAQGALPAAGKTQVRSASPRHAESGFRATHHLGLAGMTHQDPSSLARGLTPGGPRALGSRVTKSGSRP